MTNTNSAGTDEPMTRDTMQLESIIAERDEMRSKLFLIKHAASHAVSALRGEAEVLRSSGTDASGMWYGPDCPFRRRYQELCEVADLLHQAIYI